MRNLSNDEFDLVLRLTHATKTDQAFDLFHDDKIGEDYFLDFEEDTKMSLEEGIGELYEAMAYPLSHEGYGFTAEEIEVLTEMFKSFGHKDADWLKKPEKKPEGTFRNVLGSLCKPGN